ncbi:MAG: hypothetical protein IMW94_10480 [Thermoanaerobacter sp.]|nr:hypothetical protein [Thermoanaerobacter sp.]
MLDEQRIGASELEFRGMFVRKVEKFHLAVRDQAARNSRKWGYYHDLQHTMADWALILGEQTGKLQMAVLEKDPEEIKSRIVKTAAVLLEMYCRL